ncbi:hypothetical protein FEDK69T_25320 [Flavobacterium enshiense DK69]|nr:hypothetical protein FEDK69T_25320 [Flavobacterium enshiense DK69]
MPLQPGLRHWFSSYEFLLYIFHFITGIHAENKNNISITKTSS